MRIKNVLSIASLAAVAVADFQIWYITDLYPENGIGGGGIIRQSGFQQFNSDPSCDDANSATLYASNNDVSGDRVDAYVCRDCNFDDPNAPMIGELEWKTGQGHFTIYCTLSTAPNHCTSSLTVLPASSGYQITPADGGPLRGNCVLEAGDDLQCVFGPGDNYTGQRVMQCYSDLTAVDFQ